MQTQKAGLARLFFLFVLPLVFVLIGCESTPTAVSPGIGALQRGKPLWIENYPTESGYYIGIGSSNTGDEGEDMEIARSRALVNLASSISTEIKSELLIAAGESSSGEAYQTVDQVIKETVHTNIREVEVVDTFYSKSDGYWFYLRLNKSTWETMQREEADALSKRVVGLVTPVLADDETPVATRLRTLWKGWLLLAESPYSGLIEADIDGRRGVLIDLIENRITTYIDGLSLEFSPGMPETHPGKPVRFTVTVRSMHQYPPGEFALTFSFPDGIDTDPIPVRATTDNVGEYTGDMTFPPAGLGRKRIAVEIDLESLGLDPHRLGLTAPAAGATVEVTAIRAHLGVDTRGAPEELSGVNVEGAFSSLISSQLPVELTGADEAEYTISVELTGRSAPPNDFGIVIAYVTVFVSVSREGKILETYRSPEIKEGGLDLPQAYTRGFNKLVESLEGSADFAGALQSALY